MELIPEKWHSHNDRFLAKELPSDEQVIYAQHRIQGGGYSMKSLTFLKPEHIDGYLKVTDDEAIAAARNLAKNEGIFAGFSSGANLAAAIKLIRGPCEGKTVAILINDSGLKYLSTDLWSS